MRFSLLFPLFLSCSHPVLVLGVDETGTGGTGVTVEPMPPSALSIEPNRWDFSSTVLGGRMLKIFTIRNTGEVALTAPKLSLRESNVGFSVKKPCSGALGPGESCDIQIEFTIDEPGKVSTVLEVGSSSGDQASAILDGRRAGMTWSVSSYDFEAPGGASREQTFTLTGKALPRATGAIVIATENVALEILRDSCSGQTLSDGSSCAVTVRPWATKLQFQDGYLIATAERAGSARLNVAVRNVIGR